MVSTFVPRATSVRIKPPCSPVWICGCQPHFVGVRIGIGTAFIVVIVSEMIAVNNGLGFRILEAREHFLVRQNYRRHDYDRPLGFGDRCGGVLV